MKLLLLAIGAACLLHGQGSSRLQTSQLPGGHSRSVQDKLSDVVSVKDYGAMGNGTTDDTLAIQAALNAAPGGSFSISTTTGNGVSPIVVTTTAAHTFVKGATVTVSGVGGNTNANGRWTATPLTATKIALYNSAGAATTGNAAYTSGGTIKAPTTPGLYFPAGTYNISSAVTTRCTMFLSGDGPLASIIFMTVQTNDNHHHGIITPYSLTIQNLAINTTQLTTNQAMAAVFRSDGSGAGSSQVHGLGEVFSFYRYNSLGWNFGIDLGGGPDYNDFLGSVTVRECNISVGTQAGGVAEPVNVRAAGQLTVLDSSLTGDTRNDHAIYTIAVLTVLIQNNIISGHGDSSVKLLTDGFHATGCGLSAPVYPSWQILNNTITNGAFAIAAYTYCQFELQNLVIKDNIITELPETYAPNYATVFIQASCQSVMDQVTSSGNLYKDLGLGGIVVQSTVQGDTTCLATTAKGTVSHFSSINDTYINWSMSVAGFPAINSNGSSATGLKQATISHLYADGGGHGTAALNLADFQTVSVVDVTEVNTTVPAGAAPKMMLQQTDPAVVVSQTKMAPSATANPYELLDSTGALIASWSSAGVLNFINTPGVYFTNGVPTAGAHTIRGHFLLSGSPGAVTITLSGAAVYTSSTTWDCAGGELSNPPHVWNYAITSGTSVTIQGTSGDTVSLICVGN